MGTAISPRGDMPKHRVLILCKGRTRMPSPNTISTDKLARLIGTPKCPILIDVQTDEDFAANPRLIPSAIRRPWSQASEWATEFVGQSAIVICQKGQKLSENVAAGSAMRVCRPTPSKAAPWRGRTPACRWCRRLCFRSAMPGAAPCG